MSLIEEKKILSSLNKEFNKSSNDLFVVQSRLGVVVVQQIKNKENKVVNDKLDKEIIALKKQEKELKSKVDVINSNRAKAKQNVSNEWNKLKPVIKNKIKDASARIVVGATFAVPYYGQLLHVASDMYRPYQEAKLMDAGKMHRPDGSRVWKNSDKEDFEPEQAENNRRKKDSSKEGSSKKKDIDVLLKERDLEIKKLMSKGQNRGDAAKVADKNIITKLGNSKMSDDEFEKITKSELQNKVKDDIKKDLGETASKKYEAKLAEERKQQEERQKQFTTNMNTEYRNKR